MRKLYTKSITWKYDNVDQFNASDNIIIYVDEPKGRKDKEGREMIF